MRSSALTENFADIAELMLQEVRDVLSGRAITLSWESDVLQYLVKKGYSTLYGARNLRRLIQKEVEDVIAARLIELRGDPISSILLSSDGESISCIIG